MKDSLLLLLTASCVAWFAWYFWHLAARDGFDVLALVCMETLIAENIRLKRKLKKYERTDVPRV